MEKWKKDDDGEDMWLKKNAAAFSYGSIYICIFFSFILEKMRYKNLQVVGR